MKFRTRLLATTCSMAVAATMLSATMASAEGTTYTARNMTEEEMATANRKNGIDLKMDEVYSFTKLIPDEPTVILSMQTVGFSYRNPFSDQYAYSETGPSVNEDTGYYLKAEKDGGEKNTFSIRDSAWAYFYVNAAQVAYDADGNQIVTKKGKATTIEVAQPGGSNYYLDANGNDVTATVDTSNIPDGVVQYFKASETKDVTITGSGTYKVAIADFDFTNETNSDYSDDDKGFHSLTLSTNIGYFNGKVNNKDYTVSDADLQTAITEAEAYIKTLEKKIDELKDGDEEPTTEAEEPTTEAETEAEAEGTTEAETTEATTEAEDTDDNAGLIATYEGYIENIQSAIDTAKEAATKSGTKLASDYNLSIENVKLNLYDSKEAYEAGTPDRTVAVNGWLTTGMGGYEEGAGTSEYNFTQYRLIGMWTKKSDLESLPTSASAVTKDENGNYTGYITGTPDYVTDTTGEQYLTISGYDVKNYTGENAKYAVEVEFEVADGAADVFGYQYAIDEAQIAVQTAVQEAGGLVWSDLEAAIEKAAAVDSTKYTTDSYAALTTAVEAANALKSKYAAGEEVTQDEINAATAAIVSAIDGLEPNRNDTVDTDDDDDDDTDSSSNSDTSSPTTTTTTGSDSNPSTGTGVAVTAATALLVGAGYVISRKRK